MMMGHMSFLRPEWLTRLGAWWKRKIGDMEMIYDGRCGFCVPLDGLVPGVRRARPDQSPRFPHRPLPGRQRREMEKALYLVLPDGRALPGFEAYRYVVLRVPGLWWMIPFFYMPVLSRLIGHPLYNWVAANRSRLSAMRFGVSRSQAR